MSARRVLVRWFVGSAGALVLLAGPSESPGGCDTWLAMGDVTARGYMLLGKNSDRPTFGCQPLVKNISYNKTPRGYPLRPGRAGRVKKETNGQDGPWGQPRRRGRRAAPGQEGKEGGGESGHGQSSAPGLDDASPGLDSPGRPSPIARHLHAGGPAPSDHQTSPVWRSRT